MLGLGLSLILFAAASPGCDRHPAPASEQEEDEIIVAAAANLTDAFEEVGRRFMGQTRVRVTYSFGSTADLAKQIENGAPFDVFASADVRHVDQLAGRGLIEDDSRALYARGRLVLWVPPGSRAAEIMRIEDVAGPQVTRVSIAKPDVAPYGQAAVEALRALGVWQQVEPKVVYAQNVSQAKQFASTGNADVAFLPRALVREGEGRAVEIEESLHQPIEQALGIVRASRKKVAARRFVDFVLGEEGQAVLESFGYRKPGQ